MPPGAEALPVVVLANVTTRKPASGMWGPDGSWNVRALPTLALHTGTGHSGPGRKSPAVFTHLSLCRRVTSGLWFSVWKDTVLP